MTSPSRHLQTLSNLLAIFVALTGCSSEHASTNGAKRTPTAVEVDVATAVAREVIDYRDFTGRTSAVEMVEIRPRVSGYLLQTPSVRPDRSPNTEPAGTRTLPDGSPFHEVVAKRIPDQPDDGTSIEQSARFIVTALEGELVQAGDPLFEIDPQPYRLAYQQAVGNLKSTQAQLVEAQQQLARQTKLRERDATTQSDVDLAVATAAEAAGKIENLKATADRAYLDWQYTQLRSPITGRVGRSHMTRGNLAIADSTVLTTVVSTDPIYAYFDVDEASALDYRMRVAEGQVESARESTIKVSMSLANETGFPHQGVIDFVDNTTDPQTGNTKIRARFDNADGVITPGLFARIRAPFTARHQAVLIPTIALATDQQGQYLMVVDDQNIAHRRSVVVGTPQGADTAIREGIKAGERVIVAGLQRVRNDVPVKVARDSTP